MPPTFGLLITYLYCMPSVKEAVFDASGFPFIYVFRQATGSVGGTTGMTILILLLLSMITISAAASTSRQVSRTSYKTMFVDHSQTFAFARDRGLPFSDWLGRVHPKWHVPVNSVIFTCIFTVVMSLINIVSSTAFGAMLSLGATALMATYIISISCVVHARMRSEPLPPARWSLGRFGMGVNIAALIYSCWAFFWSFWPNQYHVVPTNMNFAVVLFVGLLGLSLILYFTHARKVYEGPVAKVKRMY